jgi:hypothetical protein
LLRFGAGWVAGLKVLRNPKNRQKPVGTSCNRFFVYK